MVEEGADLLSLFFQNKEVFTDEFIIDELLDFFGAAAVTSQMTTTTVIAHFIKCPADLQRVRDEIQAMKEAQIKQDPSLKDLSKVELLKRIVTLDNCMDLTFLANVINEAMRFEPPVQMISP